MTVVQNINVLESVTCCDGKIKKKSLYYFYLYSDYCENAIRNYRKRFKNRRRYTTIQLYVILCVCHVIVNHIKNIISVVVSVGELIGFKMILKS